MVAKEKRRSWYPILAKRRKMKMTAEATKIPLHRTDICTDTKRAEVAERIIRKRKNSRSSPLSVARKKTLIQQEQTMTPTVPPHTIGSCVKWHLQHPLRDYFFTPRSIARRGLRVGIILASRYLLHVCGSYYLDAR
ncbi:hypothetical protein TcG_03858 [Trypanosoma cruzi]|nr:hypothetical protein TcG_03858 [Trypanosoma cruzi]